jgi:hypothetical protein
VLAGAKVTSTERSLVVSNEVVVGAVSTDTTRPDATAMRSPSTSSAQRPASTT